jgi:DNA-binding MarR family transcriptional regulator
MLAERLRVTRGAVTQLVAGLVTAGLDAQAPDADDGRKRVLELTEMAKAMIGEFEAQLVTQLARRFDALDNEQLGRLADLLAGTTT